MKLKNQLPGKVFSSLFYLMAGFVFIIPVIRLLIMGFTLNDGGLGLANYIDLFEDPRTVEAIWNTVIIAIGSTVTALILGVGFAFIIAYTNIKRKRLMEVLVLAPFVIPSYIISLSWSSLLDTKGIVNQALSSMRLPVIDIYTIGGMILVMGICSVPMVYISVISMFRKIPRDLEWAARASGYSQAQAMLKINLIQARPAIISGGILAFLAAVDNFAIPAFLGISSGIPVLSTYIYEKAISFGPGSFNSAAALSVILSFIAIGGIAVQSVFIKKSSGIESIVEDYSARIEMTTWVRRLTEGLGLGFLCIVNIVPFITMMMSAFQKVNGVKFGLDNFTMKNFEFILGNRGVHQAIFNSLTLSLLTCVICIVIGMVVAYLKIRKHKQGMRAVESAASLTYSLPGIVLALAMIFHWSMVPGVYGTVKILLIAYITRYLILQIKGCSTAFLSIDPAIEEAAMVSGRTRVVIWVKILIPLLAKQVLSNAFLIFMSAATELTLSSMLASAGTKTIGLTIFNLQQSGDYNLSAAMAVLIVAAVLILYMVSVLTRCFGNIKEKLKKQKKMMKSVETLKEGKNHYELEY